LAKIEASSSDTIIEKQANTSKVCPGEIEILGFRQLSYPHPVDTKLGLSCDSSGDVSEDHRFPRSVVFLQADIRRQSIDVLCVTIRDAVRNTQYGACQLSSVGYWSLATGRACLAGTGR
jgi:hypothetical protein